MTLTIKELNTIENKDFIDFCDHNQQCWTHHKGIAMLDNNLNLSFGVAEGGKLLAFCPLVMETRTIANNVYNVGSLWGISLPGPVISAEINGDDHLKKINNLLYENLQFIAKKHKIVKITYNLSSSYYNRQRRVFLYNELTRYGFLDNSLKMMLLDLKLNEQDSLKKLSKGHRSILKKYCEGSRFEYLNWKNAPLSFDQFAQCMLTIEQFTEPHLEYLYTLYQHENAEICHAYYQEKLVGSAVFLKCHDVVQYHEAQRFIAEDIPVHHLIVWNAIHKYREDNYEFMDMGVFSYHSQLNYILSSKTDRVAVFKRGFGSEILPFMLGEAYFDRPFFEAEFQQRIMKYKETILL